MDRFFTEVRSALGGEPVRSIRDFTVTQEVGKHDLVSFRTVSSNTGLSRWRTAHPINVLFGDPGRGLRNVSSYMFSAEPESSGITARSLFDVVLVGATMPLKNAGREVWVDVHAWEIVQRVAKTFRLASRVDRVGSRFPIIRQDGRSYWEVLTDLARREGMLLYMDGATIHFRDPSSLERSQVPQALPHFSDRWPRVRASKVELGEIGPQQPANKKFVLVDRQGSVIASLPSAYNTSVTRSRPLLEEDIVTDELSSPVEELRAIDRRNRAFHRATATFDGHVLIQPGRGVYLQGVSARTEGFWLVTKASHHYDRGEGEYFTRASLQRSDVAETFRRPPVVSSSGKVAVAGGGMSDPRTLGRIDTRLVSGRWVAA